MPRMARISFIMPLISAAAFSLTCASALAIICCMRAMSTGSEAAWRGAAGRGAAGRWAGAAGRCGVANWVCNWGRGWAISDRGRRRSQRSGIVVGQREDFHHAIDLAVRQDHGIGAQRFAHLAQRIARRGARKFLDIHDRPPKAGVAQYWLNCVTIIDSCCLSAVFHMDTDHSDSFHY